MGKHRPSVEISCLTCGNKKLIWQSRIDIGKGKFCSTRCGKLGKNNPFWVDGTRKSQGYIKIYKPDHPFCDKKNYVSEHRLVMEVTLERYLLNEEVIHHRNGNRLDNSIDNLQLCANQSEHIKIHRHLTDSPRFTSAKVMA